MHRGIEGRMEGERWMNGEKEGGREGEWKDCVCLCLYNLCGVLQLESCHSEAAEESGAGGVDCPSTAHRQSE